MTQAEVILLDEPTAHLDAESGRALMADLRAGLRSRTVVLVTHNPDDISPDDALLALRPGRKALPGKTLPGGSPTGEPQAGESPATEIKSGASMAPSRASR
jgi:ATP-binding cassette subfamily C protein CydCD